MRNRWMQSWPSYDDLAESVILGRQVLTLMAVAFLITGGFYVNAWSLGFQMAWHAFELGAFWVSHVDMPGRVEPPTPPGDAAVRQPPRPTGGPPTP